jgi:signal transduction histidine kinase
MARLLIVEDSSVTAKVLAHHLGQAGHDCRTVPTGEEALAEYKKQRPDLSIMDYMLPDTNGLALLQSVMREDPQALVIMVTGQGDQELAAEVIKRGARDYVVKTAQYAQALVAVVDKVLREEIIQKDQADKARQNERLAAQNELVFWMAHNFKNMLGGTAGFLELLDLESEGRRSDKERLFLHEARDSLAKALGMIDMLLQLTSLTPGPPQQVDLAKVVALALERVRERTATEAVSGDGFEFFNTTQGLAPVMISAADAQLVLENLLVNAVEALPGAGGRVAVLADIKEGWLELKVRDTGRGMSPEILAKATQPLFSTKGTVGVGLGLSLVQAALRRNGGELILDSSPGHGTTATVRWPLPR